MKKIITIIMAICLIASVICITAFAAEETLPEPAVGTLLRVTAIKGKDTVLIGDYDIFEDGWNAAMELAGNAKKMNNNKYERIIVDLYADWNADKDGNFTDDAWYEINGDGFNNDTIYIPDGAKVTLNLGGHTINRGLTEYQHNGEVIYIDNGADVIINGGKDGDPIVRDGDNSGGVKMGTITGGFSCNGAGGIHINDNANVVLNNVRVVGNKVEDDDGAGIYVEGGADLAVNGGSISDNLLICKNVSNVYGAGIYVEGGTVSLYKVMLRNNNSNGQKVYHPDYYYHCYGAAIYMHDSVVTADSCLLYNNGHFFELFLDTKCVIYVSGNSQMTFKQTMFKENGSRQRAANTIPYGADLFSVGSGCSLTLESCYFTENSAEVIINTDSNSILNVSETVFKNNYSAVYNYYGSASNGGSCNFNKCTFENNSPGEIYSYVFNLKAAGNNPTFVDCNLGNSSFDERSKANFLDTDAKNGVGTIFGEGSITNILVIISLIACGVSIFLTVYYNKKKSAPAAKGAAKSDDEE